jgi:hypothetical protein
VMCQNWESPTDEWRAGVKKVVLALLRLHGPLGLCSEVTLISHASGRTLSTRLLKQKAKK